MVLWQRVAQHARDVREWRNGVQLTGNILSSFTWNHLELKVWVFMKLMSDYGVLVKAFETTSSLYVTPNDSSSMQDLLMQEHKQKYIRPVFVVEGTLGT